MPGDPSDVSDRPITYRPIGRKPRGTGGGEVVSHAIITVVACGEILADRQGHGRNRRALVVAGTRDGDQSISRVIISRGYDGGRGLDSVIGEDIGRGTDVRRHSVIRGAHPQGVLRPLRQRR